MILGVNIFDDLMANTASTESRPFLTTLLRHNSFSSSEGHPFSST